jgi:tagatose 1,6-diphosphate aldolase
MMDAALARSLDQLAGADGIICAGALDHRDSLRLALQRKRLPQLDDAGLAALKVRLTRALAPAATALLLDAEVGAPAALAQGALPGRVGLGVPLEAQGYEDLGRGRRTTLLRGFGPTHARRLGACACKLLLPYRPDDAASATAQDEVVREVAAGCARERLVFLLEPIVYPLEGEQGFEARFGDLVVETARRLRGLGPTVLKVQHPGSPVACAALDEACAGLPWVLLGGGATAGALEAQVEDACRAGASGFVVGRTLWDAALVEDPDEQERLAREHGAALLRRLSDTARRLATPWRERVGELSAPPPGWYRSLA